MFHQNIPCNNNPLKINTSRVQNTKIPLNDDDNYHHFSNKKAKREAVTCTRTNSTINHRTDNIHLLHQLRVRIGNFKTEPLGFARWHLGLDHFLHIMSDTDRQEEVNLNISFLHCHLVSSAVLHLRVLSNAGR